MQLSTFVAAALLPLVAMAEYPTGGEVTSTSTSVTTMTHYITLSQITSTAYPTYAVNTTMQTFYPTGSWTSPTVNPTGEPSVVPNSAGTLGSAHVVIAGIAAMAVASLM